MGTVVSIDVRSADGPIDAAVERAVAWFHAVDARFSTFRDDSEIRRLDRGELPLDDCHPDVRHVLRTCEDLRQASNGVFDVRRHRPDGGLDPSGFVKGWAVDEAADLLAAAGATAFSINAGGDAVVRGEPEPGMPWRVGIRHPGDRGALAAVLEIRDNAVATSGHYERGSHIRDPRTGAGASGLVSVTVLGPHLGTADAYATAAFAMGGQGPGWVARQEGFGVLAIDEAGLVTWSDLVGGVLAGATTVSERRAGAPFSDALQNTTVW